MKKLSIEVLVITACIFFANQSFSQNSLDADSIRTGVSYKFVLFNDTEIIGKAVWQDSLYIKVKGEGGTYRLKKEDIFFVSRNLIRDNFAAILSFGGGLSFINPISGGSTVFVYKPKIAAQFSAIFPIGEYKGIRADAGYSLWKRDEFVSTHNEGYEKYSSVTKQYISLKADFVYGLISPINKFWIYGSAGLGIHFLLDSPGDRFSSHYSYYDSAYHNYTYYDEGRTNVSSVFSIGFAVGYRFNKQLGFYADTQLNTVSHSTFFLAFFDSGESYIPVRAGVTYILY